MGRKFIDFYLMILVSVLIGACTKNVDGLPGTAGPSGESGTSIAGTRSNIFGYVKLVSQFAVPDTLRDSVKVSTRMGDSLVKVMTDKNGKFTLPQLKSGTYRILLEKNLYDSIAYTVVHTAGNEDKFIGILQMDGSLTTHITQQELLLQTNSSFGAPFQYLNITTTIDGPPITLNSQRYVNFYFSDSPDISDKNYLFSAAGNSHSEGSNEFFAQVSFVQTEINGNRFSPGDTVYMKTYFVPYYSLMDSWFDINTYQTISYPYTGHSFSNYFIWAN